MKLVGRYDSRFVRRVAVALHVLGMPFALVSLSPFSQAAAIRRFSAINRIPDLILRGGDTLIDSAAILDYLDEIAGPGQALLPSSESERANH